MDKERGLSISLIEDPTLDLGGSGGAVAALKLGRAILGACDPTHERGPQFMVHAGHEGISGPAGAGYRFHTAVKLSFPGALRSRPKPLGLLGEGCIMSVLVSDSPGDQRGRERDRERAPREGTKGTGGRSSGLRPCRQTERERGRERERGKPFAPKLEGGRAGRLRLACRKTDKRESGREPRQV